VDHKLIVVVKEPAKEFSQHRKQNHLSQTKVPLYMNATAIPLSYLTTHSIGNCSLHYSSPVNYLVSTIQTKEAARKPKQLATEVKAHWWNFISFPQWRCTKHITIQTSLDRH